MPVQPQVKWPGVYIQEVESNVRTIVPVPTADTAFVGRARKGPVDEAIVCHSFADFEKTFGGLWEESLLGHAVSDFFSNGGTAAVVVRVFKASNGGGDGGGGDGGAKADLPRATFKLKNNIVLEAASPGTWAKNLEIKVRREDDPAIARALAEKLRISEKDELNAGDVYNLEVYQGGEEPVETFNGVTFKNSVRSVARVLEQSNLVRVKVNGATAAPPEEQGAGEESDAAPTDATITALKARLQSARDAAAPKVETAKQVQLEYNAKLAERDLAKAAADKATAAEKQARDATLGGLETDLENMKPVLEAAQKGAAEASAVVAVEQAALLAAQRQALAGVGLTPSPMDADTVGPDPALAPDDGEAPDAGDLLGSAADRTGMYALDTVPFNLLVFPDYVHGASGPDGTLLKDAGAYCRQRRAMLLLDAPADWDGLTPKKVVESFKSQIVNGVGDPGTNAAFYYPRIRKANPLHDGQIEAFSPLGAIAGVYARTDATRGVWKAPAGLDAALGGVVGLTADLTDQQNGELNPVGVNCLRRMPSGNVIWGARTLKGDDRLANQWKYIPVRRTALFIEETLFQNTQWAVFEPNDEPLWSTLRLNIGAFMHGLFRQGAFQGGSPKDAYFVQCDASTTTQADIDRGIVNIVVGFAPLKPAEFVIIYIQQKANLPAA